MGHYRKQLKTESHRAERYQELSVTESVDMNFRDDGCIVKASGFYYDLALGPRICCLHLVLDFSLRARDCTSLVSLYVMAQKVKRDCVV